MIFLLIIEIGILYTIGGNGYKWVRRYGIKCGNVRIL